MKKLFPLLVLCMLYSTINAQKVFIDQPIRVGEFIVFPSVDDPNAFYYSPNKPRVAKSKDGKPQFSFLLFKEKNRSDVTKKNIEDQIGGGVVHALVEYGLTDSQVERLRSMLKEIKNDAVLKGPIVYKSGNIALVSAIADKNNGHVNNVIGVGKAPILENQKASIAFMLDTKGAKLLWSSFQTETPDIDFKFEMEMSGYLSPINGYLKGTFDQIYESHDMSLAASGSLGPITLGAEIGATFDKLRREGKIKVYTEGDDKEMQRLIMAGYKKLADMIFEPLNASYSQMANNDPSKNNASAFDQLSKLKVLEDEEIDPLSKAQAMEDWKSGNGVEENSVEKKPKINRVKPKESDKLKKAAKESKVLGDSNKGIGFYGSGTKSSLFKPIHTAGGSRLNYVLNLKALSLPKAVKNDNNLILNTNFKKTKEEYFINLSKVDVFQDSRLKYENKHKDLVELHYRKKWVKSSGNQSVLVSLRHANIVVENWKEAFKESRNNSAKGRKWITFNPSGNDEDEVSMEAWRFRGLVDICTISYNSRNELKDYLEEHEGEIMEVIEADTIDEHLADGVEEIVRDYANEEDEDENLNLPDMPLNSGTQHLARDVDEAFEYLENNDSNKNNKISGIATMDDWNAETADEYYNENHDLVLIRVNEEFVKNKKLLLDGKYIHVSKKHLITILEDCSNAVIEAEVNEGDLYETFSYKSSEYGAIKIDLWRLQALVKTYCADKEKRKDVLGAIDERSTWLSYPGQKIGRFLVMNDEVLMNIFDNYQEALNEWITYDSNVKRGIYNEKLIHEFENFGMMEPSQFKKALDLCKDEKAKNGIINKLNFGSKGGRSQDDYFDYNLFLHAYNRVLFINSIRALKLNEPQQSSPAPFSIYATYKFRQTKIEGDFNLEFNKVSAGTQPMYFSENIGNIKEKCESCFKIVSLDEMEMFKQREVLVILDGSILSNFKKFINSASITLRKEHPDNKFENEYANITYTNFKDTGNVHKMVYGWQGDDSETWGDYQYKVDWNFFQNYEVKGEFQDYDGDVLSISPPVSLKTVSIEADPDFVADNNIKYITIKLSYGYGTRKQSGYVDLDAGGQFVSKPIRLRADGILSKQVGLILPNEVDEFSYTYKVTTIDGKNYQSGELKSTGLLIDEIHEIPTKD
ncbi:hypothetical protein JQC67_16795 [Aurantibacter crassamenti]|uniref:hypothetical protein n=1 Tax=Aurantibacter crassamenti TaxID=1837375 RepID=UPI00193A2C63|nr:hypothetical protein [Aurantibacter crassamenti]MBM1107815.1 hypothetical protein [Aurantibacter crassamenti]